jgi:hypothetical protein
VKTSSFRAALTGWAYGGVPIAFLSFVVVATMRADPLPPFLPPASYWAIGLFIALVVSGATAMAVRAPRQGWSAAIYAVCMSLTLAVLAVFGSIAAGDIH